MGKRKVDRLIFVFDANSGKWDAFVDSAKKTLRLKGCALCAITHGLLGEKEAWKECKEGFGIPIDYVHKDEMDHDLKKVAEGNLPCVISVVDGEPIMLILPDVLEQCKGSVSELKGQIQYHCAINDLEIALL